MLNNKLRLFILAGASLALLSASALAVEFKPYGRGSFAQLRKQHAERPLVVHFWSMTCPPCLAELSQWAKVVTEKKTADFVFVNTDSKNDRSRAQDRLDKAGLSAAEHYGFADDFVERLYFEADNSWRGELPFTALIGGDASLITVTGPIDDPLLTDWLAKLNK